MPSAITIGADPEFGIKEISSSNPQAQSIVPARKVIHGSNLLGSSIGLDGSNVIGELRPNPASTALELYQNIDSLLSQLATTYKKEYAFYAGSYPGYATGGHIHFGGISPSDIFLRLLDRFISNPLNKVSYAKRRGSYAKLSQYRNQPHGWEYRSCPSWLSAPIVTKGVLCIAEALIKIFQNGEAGTRTITRKLLYQQDPTNGSIREFYSLIRTLKKDNKKLESIEILQAWGKREDIKERKKRKNIRLSGVLVWKQEHENVGRIQTFLENYSGTFRSPIIITGARQDRGSREIIYLSNDLLEKMRERIPKRMCGVAIASLAPPIGERVIALSYNLRQRNPAFVAKVLKTVLNRIHYIEREGASQECVESLA